MNQARVSVIIPARNEEALIGQTVEHAIASCEHYASRSGVPRGDWEILVVDNGSDDSTPAILQTLCERSLINVIRLDSAGAARARNAGRVVAKGGVLVFVDADTVMPLDCITRIANHCDHPNDTAGITALGSLEGGLRSQLWWSFWNMVRRLPIPRAKAMPALMFCTATTFDAFGPFDEDVAIGEEWPILAGLYRHSPGSLIYDRSIVAKSSSRRMDQIAFGYSRTLCKWAWAVLHRSGRIEYTDTIR